MLTRRGRIAVMLSTAGMVGASWTLAGPQPVSTAAAAPSPTASTAIPVPHPQPDPSRFIVTFKGSRSHGGTSTSHSFADLARTQGAAIRTTRTTGLGDEVVQLSKDLSPRGATAFMAALDRRSDVAGVEMDQVVHLADTPNDPDLDKQWDATDPRTGINLSAARDRSTGKGVTVGVVDTGITQHPDLDANVVPGYDFISDTSISRDGDGRDSDASDPGTYSDASCSGNPRSEWHGTHVSGTVAAVTNNGIGVAGTAGDATVEPLRAMGACGAGHQSDIIDAML